VRAGRGAQSLSFFVSHHRVQAGRTAGFFAVQAAKKKSAKKYRRFTGGKSDGITMQVLATAREKPPAQKQ